MCKQATIIATPILPASAVPATLASRLWKELQQEWIDNLRLASSPESTTVLSNHNPHMRNNHIRAIDMNWSKDMTSPFRSVPQPLHLNGLPVAIQSAFGPIFDNMNDEAIRARKTPDEKFAELDVQPGDRIRLTEARALTYPSATANQIPKEDAAVLEGKVRKVKSKGPNWYVQIEGFHVAGNGIYWPVANYIVEVLSQAYRWTPEDRLIAELAGLTPSAWEKKSINDRGYYRSQYGKRADRVKRILAGEL